MPATRIADRAALIEAVATDVDRLCTLVAEDVGEGPDDVRTDVELALALLAMPQQRDGTAADRARAELTARGAAGAERGVPTERLIDRFMSALPAIWNAARDLDPEPEALQELASWLLRGADIAALAIAEGYLGRDRAVVARDVTARRAFLEELLTTISHDAAGGARLRRLAVRYGLDPTAAYRLIAVSLPASMPHDEAHDLADRLAARVDAPSSADLARGASSLLGLPQVIARGRRIVVLARADWPGALRLHRALDELTPGWVAVGSAPIEGVDGLSLALAGLVETLRAAERLGRPGWIEDADDLAVERLLLLDESLLRRVVDRELGALLQEPRMGSELVETLRVFFEAGENMRETARRLHLAPRTVAYRLERIEELIGRPLDGDLRPRLSVALLAYRALGGAPPSR
ncbi:MAG TPA: helix-turn-helix domain-containing protein [Candidatus Limnocylindrales bacterium]|nr:helix-turn-helix domain-containing protein [Candidatus Limnocylindrales bacterium]